MFFGIPKEVRPLEFRVGLTPAAVDSLVRQGHQVAIEHNAGLNAGFTDANYEAAGGQIVYTDREVYGRADVVVKVGRPVEAEYNLFNPNQTILSFLHLAVASRDLIAVLEEKKITTIGYDTIQADNGSLPVLGITSEIAGRLSPNIAAEQLSSFQGGRGILLSGVPGTPPAAVVVLGAGVLGFNAIRSFHRIGAQVVVLDKSLPRLQFIDNAFQGQVATMFASPKSIAKAAVFADVLVSAAAIPGGKAPTLITREILSQMRPRAVFIDFAINSGGSAETSHPTTLNDPTYVEEGIIHYCVPNVPSRVARTASYAMTNAILPYLLEMGEAGTHKAFETLPDLKRGVNTLDGKLIHPTVAATMRRQGDTSK